MFLYIGNFNYRHSIVIQEPNTAGQTFRCMIDFNSKVNLKMKINLGDKKDNLTCFAFLTEMSCWASLNYSINIWQCFVLVIAGVLTFFYSVRWRGWVDYSDNDLGHFPL